MFLGYGRDSKRSTFAAERLVKTTRPLANGSRPTQLKHAARDPLRRDIQLFAKIHRWPDDMTDLLRSRRESLRVGIFLTQN